MPLAEDIDCFVVWAAKLGFPMEDIPNEESIKSIFKSRQCEVFFNLMKRVRPRQEVAEIRENILIKKLDKINDLVVPACSRSFLPKELKMFLKVKELKSKRSELEARIEEHKKEYEKLASSIKIKNMQHIKLKHKKETLQARVNIFDVKLLALKKSIKNEKINKKRLIVNMPVKLSAKNACETGAAQAVKAALQELDDFYNFYANNTNPHYLQDAKDELWNKIRNIFANLPNFMLYNAIVRFKEEQLQNIMTLNKSSNNDSSSSPAPYTTFELKLLKTKAELLGIVAKYLAARHERELLEERFSSLYPQFVDELLKKVNLFNTATQEQVEETISDYIVQYNLRNHSKSQNEFLTEQIELYKTHLEVGARQLEDHEVLLGSIKQVYNEISSSINRIQYEMLQLNQIKQKILYSKNMLQHMLHDLKTTTNAAAANNNISNFLSAKLKICGNNSIMGGESFDLSSDVFSSTKLDLNSSVSFNNTTLRRSFGNAGDTTIMAAGHSVSGGRYTLPQHLTELCTFAEIPLETFSFMTKECAFYLSPNPLIVSSQELSSTIQLSPGILLTPYGALQEARNRIKFTENLKELSKDLKLDLELTFVDTQAFKTKIKQQRDQIAELLDKIEVSGINTNRILQKISKFYDFALENPLRHYIPASKCYNNQTYSDYESEYMMYYRMATVGASIK